MADIVVANNRANLVTQGAAWKAGAQAEPIPADAIEGKTGTSTHTGDATATAFTVTHGYGKAPTVVFLTATSAAAAAIHRVSAKDATTFTITFTAAPPAAANNITFNWLAV